MMTVVAIDPGKSGGIAVSFAEGTECQAMPATEADIVECLRGVARSALSAWKVERLHQVLGGDPMTEEIVLQFIGSRWAAKNLFLLPDQVATEALRRPVDFIRAAKEFCSPTLRF